MSDDITIFLSQRIDALSVEFNKRFDAVEGQIRTLYGQLSDINREIGIIQAKAHNPGLCSLSPEVERLTLNEARRGGMFAVVGVISGLVASGVIAAIMKFIPER